MRDSKSKWNTLETNDLQVEYLQSSELDSYQLFRWEKDGSGPDQLASALQNMKYKEYRKIVLGGFSAACNTIARTITEKSISPDLIVFVGPWLPSFDQTTFAILAKKLSESKVLIICGDKDEDCSPHAHALHQALKSANISCQFYQIPDLAHNFPPDFADLVSQWIK
jgi:predicted esterase